MKGRVKILSRGWVSGRSGVSSRPGLAAVEGRMQLRITVGVLLFEERVRSLKKKPSWRGAWAMGPEPLWGKVR